MKIIPGEIKTAQLHAYLLGAIAPRPICFASTIDSNGVANLSPFSFFNVFGSKPPILIFSPARRVRIILLSTAWRMYMRPTKW